MTLTEAVQLYGGIKPAARATGVPATTFRNRYLKEAALCVPRDPPQHLPIEALLDQAAQRFEVKRTIDNSEQWPVIEIKDRLPIGVLWFGDPHLGDNGCDIQLLRRHVELCTTTAGLYGANIGDTTNNWMTQGKLAKQWAEQDTGLATERRLAQWLMLESGVNWLVWLVGNHDAWNSGESVLRLMNSAAIFMRNWEAKFRLQFPTGEQVKVHAAHNFKGFSDWNPMHGPLKAAIKTSDADLYVAGHIHTPGSMQINLEGSGRFPLMLRVASYKRFDTYAKLGGFSDHSTGCAVLTIFNPDANDRSGKITHFFDVELGARVLTMMRKASNERSKQRHKARCGKSAARAHTPRRALARGTGAPSRRGKVHASKLGKGHDVGARDRSSRKARRGVQVGARA